MAENAQSEQYADLIGTTTAAGVLEVDRSTVWRLVDNGKLFPYARIGKALVFKREDVERIRDQRAAGTL